MAKLKIKPLGDRVLVEPAEEAEVKKGGIIIPDSAKEKPQESNVIRIESTRTDLCFSSRRFVEYDGHRV